MTPHPTHELFKDGDPLRPEEACDLNGQLALQVCKKCGEFEAGLKEPCKPNPKLNWNA